MLSKPRALHASLISKHDVLHHFAIPLFSCSHFWAGHDVKRSELHSRILFNQLACRLKYGPPTMRCQLPNLTTVMKSASSRVLPKAPHRRAARPTVPQNGPLAEL